MNELQKQRLFKDLLITRSKITWAAQKRVESSHEYGYRMLELLEHYNNIGKIAQIEFTEVTQSAQRREEMAIYTFVKGLKPETSRYMCDHKYYKRLHDAVQHAKLIDNNLESLKRLRRVSTINFDASRHYF